MDPNKLGDTGSVFLDPLTPFALVTGREGGGDCHLQLYYHAGSDAMTPPEPAFGNVKGDQVNNSCIDPGVHPYFEVDGAEPPGNAAFTQILRLTSDNLTDRNNSYLGARGVPGDDAIVEAFPFVAAGGQFSWYDINPAHHFTVVINPDGSSTGVVAAVKASGGRPFPVIYVLTMNKDKDGHYVGGGGHLVRGVSNGSNDFQWVPISSGLVDPGVLVVNPYDDNDVYVCDACYDSRPLGSSPTIKHSSDGGQHWVTDQQLTDIASQNGTYRLECSPPYADVVAVNSCPLHNIYFDPHNPSIRVAVLRPGGLAFSRSGGRDWLDLDVTHTGTGLQDILDPQPLETPSGAYYDPTLVNGQPSLHVSLNGAGVQMVQGPFAAPGEIKLVASCAACKQLTYLDDTHQRQISLRQFRDGTWRSNQLLNLSGLSAISFHFSIDGVVTSPQTVDLRGAQETGAVTVTETCSSSAGCTPTKFPTAIVAAPASRLGGQFPATLDRSDNGAPIAGQLIVFTVSGLLGTHTLCSAVTAPDGRAACHGVVPIDALLATRYKASFAGSLNYLPSQASGTLSL
jgi:hypothetical protein